MTGEVVDGSQSNRVQIALVLLRALASACIGFFLIQLVGYVIHSIWLMQLASFFDVQNFLLGFAPLMVVGVWSIGLGAVKFTLRYLRDRHRLGKALKAPARDREQIAANFLSFELASFQGEIRGSSGAGGRAAFRSMAQ